jgi:hypothetical protein
VASVGFLINVHPEITNREVLRNQFHSILEKTIDPNTAMLDPYLKHKDKSDTMSDANENDNVKEANCEITLPAFVLTISNVSFENNNRITTHVLDVICPLKDTKFPKKSLIGCSVLQYIANPYLYSSWVFTDDKQGNVLERIIPTT